MPIHIDSRAVVSPKATISDGVQVGPFAVIEDDVAIGEGTTIGAHAVIHSGSRIGRECRIHPMAAIGGFPQDLKFKGEPTTLEIGDNTVVREFVTLNRATAETGRTIIGSNCLFMAYAHVGHDCVVGDNVILANCSALGGHVHVGSWVILGGLTPVHQFCHIGDHAMIGGGFRVVKDVPPYILAGSEPLIFERLNVIGLRRRGFSEKSIELLDKTYRLIYRSSLNVSQAVARIAEEVEPCPEVETVLSFIAKSKRGIISGYVHH
ncbi:MAG: Acyl-[acyl-carrier-protein]--UDP-N-acetylglucosamine O-acyltransferase [Bacteroidetes bacterium]|nr:Acyl-[acyl-carrier-protein]--UDP-N-acetylglucosamine O-acyltransferase [Bacteroidota bacterium]